MATRKEQRKRLPSLGGENQQRTKKLFRALEEGCTVATINLLFKEGSLQTNARSSTGQTLLHVAVLYGRCNTVIRRLVRAGCPIDSADHTGDTALHLAVRYRRNRIAVELQRGVGTLAAQTRGKCQRDNFRFEPIGPALGLRV
ncbi:hypothetical protein TSAR_006384 [Trichomalopsis sarcophagae]|uniref:Uncharacterized protein n=1 Tax=Trichomalopsis sarcophagae TaxID=543379 RepID=A0A232F3E0_9HYME|nr:hypothetical protein TSAR_006384 [Trichomalopsis sarcophagae]